MKEQKKSKRKDGEKMKEVKLKKNRKITRFIP